MPCPLTVSGSRRQQSMLCAAEHFIWIRACRVQHIMLCAAHHIVSEHTWQHTSRSTAYLGWGRRVVDVYLDNRPWRTRRGPSGPIRQGMVGREKQLRATQRTRVAARPTKQGEHAVDELQRSLTEASLLEEGRMTFFSPLAHSVSGALSCLSTKLKNVEGLSSMNSGKTINIFPSPPSTTDAVSFQNT
jgi:hypothetical protein